MTIRFTSGALATVAANGMLPPRVGSTQLQIQGDKGILGFDRRNGGVYVQTERAAEAHHARDAGSGAGEWRGGRAQELCAGHPGRGGTARWTEVAINEARILDAAYRSAASGCEVCIES